MSWLEKLYKTYENNQSHIGEGVPPLLPIGHTMQNAHVEIALEGSGNFLRASIVEKTDAATIIPATEDAEMRVGSKPMHYALCDKLQYVAGDFLNFGGEVTSGFDQDRSEPYKAYLRDLAEWCASPYRHVKVTAVYSYVNKGHCVADLKNAGILPVDDDGKLVKSRSGRTRDESSIFRLITNPEDAFVRWKVEIPGDLQPKLWRDPMVWKSWADFLATKEAGQGICYVTGKMEFLGIKHPKKIRGAADGAKLISSNDKDGFTYLGRFTSAEEAYGLGLETSHKAHSALRWLLGRQGVIEYVKEGGRKKPSLAVVAWAVSGKEIPGLLADTASLIGLESPTGEAKVSGYTAQETGVALKKLLAGYSARLTPTEEVIVMALDSATPGRMAIRYYRELRGSEFLERVQAWHTGCSWRQQYARDKMFIGAPAPRDIAEAAYGARVDDKLRQATVERLLPCIVDGTKIPDDLVDSCVRRASHRLGSLHGSSEAQKQYWQWEKALGIACALFKYQHKERGYTMALDRDRNTRDYLYGRLLALAEQLEGRALYVAGEQRETNAGRLMQRFAERPSSTWRTIETSLTPYKARLRVKRGAFLHNMETEMDEVEALFDTDDFLSDRRLSGEFLLAYHCQRSALKGTSTDETGTEETELGNNEKEIR